MRLLKIETVGRFIKSGFFWPISEGFGSPREKEWTSILLNTPTRHSKALKRDDENQPLVIYTFTRNLFSENPRKLGLAFWGFQVVRIINFIANLPRFTLLTAFYIFIDFCSFYVAAAMIWQAISFTSITRFTITHSILTHHNSVNTHHLASNKKNPRSTIV